MIREKKPAGTKHALNVQPKDRRASKGDNAKEIEKRRLSKKLKRLKKK
ncbi:TPA: hypothetical protein ACOIVK_001558 [Enterococcus faecalis]|nr:hypothetical protein [Enterococcus faecalis]EKC6783243.1 hypothetical protein [Enterococcus faecalis]KDE18332.1 hypothetical protein HMPREF2097_00620 [Enterococcus faecalis 918]MDQ6123172.1 hypothetical protein [Enterococcus faecalis]HBD0806681.1 hypothetical protein [Enterococcus faecalis]HBD0813242.1 hypothetical protein [Enterococcus faecalis]